MSMAKSVRRLYSSFQPDSYAVELNINPMQMSIKGKVVIDGVKVGRPSQRLTFHQKNLNVKSVKVTTITTKGNKELKVSRINYQKSIDELRLHFAQLIYPGRYRVEIEYYGRINTKLHGVYAAKFKDKNQTKVIICTQLESHYAREALPCIDEPEAKSVFSLTLKTPKSLPTVISNTDVIKVQEVAGHTVTKFADTPKMSTYLLAFVAGELKYLESSTKNGVRVRTYATAGNVKHTEFALECAKQTLDFYDEYFAIRYPLSKCDLIALPDFAAGAMENWGCITFREQSLIVDPRNTSLDLKQYVANVIAHELTHQWFGNLVTMRWWNDLWLNESFASWMSYLAVNHLFPEWQVWTQFIVDEQSIGLKQDSLEHTHPIEVKINNPEEIRTVFDPITYEKGASVLTMLHDYLGSHKYREGIRLYLKRYSYANTSTEDLWQALEEASGLPVKKFMVSWTTQSGYPLLKTNYYEGSVHIEQHRFYINPNADKDRNIWPVPLFSELDVGRNNPLWHRSLNLTLNSPPTSVLLNKGRRGFYRVIYDNQTFSNIMSDDFINKVSDVDRLGLIADAFEAAKGGYLPTLTALDMLKAYFSESSVVVWDVISSALGSLRTVMDDEKLRDQMKPFIRSLVKNELKRLGFNSKPSDSHFDRLLRPIILGMAAIADEPSVLKEIKELFYAVRPEAIDPDIRGVVYVTIARHGTETDFDLLVKMHNESSSAEERLKLAAAITSFKQPEINKRAISLIRSEEVRLQDVGYWVSYIFANPYSRDLAWPWLKENWGWLRDNLGEDISFYRLPLYVARCYSSADFLQEFTDFFTKNMPVGLDRSLKQAIETITWQSEWQKRDFKSVKQFFIDN